MPRSLLSNRYNFTCLKANNKMSGLFAKTSKCSKISDPLKRQINTKRKKKNAKDFQFRLHSYQLSLLRSNEWLTSDLVPFTTRYELEKRHNIELMAHYGDAEENIEDSMVETVSDTDTDDQITDSNEENEYIEPKPRRINFDDLELGNENTEILQENNEANNQNTKKSLDDGVYKKFSCDVCHKNFDKKWALNSHTVMHSGDKPFHCTYKTCTKQYADRSNLRAHQRSKMHHTWKIFCNQCTKPFSDQRYLNLHSLSACRKYLASINKKVTA